jgi:hypothetical protein
MSVVSQNFLEETIEALFDETDLSLLTEEQKDIYRPQFLIELEARIGNAIMPQLDSEGLDEFVRMIDDPQTAAEDWNKFWTGHIPNFEALIKQTVSEFASEMAQALT